MFKKKPQIKALSPIRSSDRRRTADKIISDYGLQVPVVEGDDKNAANAGHTSLRNSLLPDNIQSARFTTTHGPDLKQLSGTVFVGSYDGGDHRVLWFKIEEQMYPSGISAPKMPFRRHYTDDLRSLHVVATSSTPSSSAYPRHRRQEDPRRRRSHDTRSCRRTTISASSEER